jgi:predicted phosphodiesterase
VSTVEANDLKAENDEQQRRIEQLMDFHDRLGDIIVARLARLKTTARLPLESGHEMVVVHGSPSDPTEAMTADMDDEELNALVGDDPADLIVCGASHVPFVRELGEIRIVNVGSVGESPTPGIADAAIITSNPLSVDIAPFSVELDA